MVEFCKHCKTTVETACSEEYSVGCLLKASTDARRAKGKAIAPKVMHGSALEGSVPTGALKPTNPKDAIGIKKSPISTLSGVVLIEVALGCMEGALKYGRHNWRAAKVRYSVYYDATIRHLMLWWEGEDCDPDTGLSHITKAICSLMVLRDAMIHDMVEDDRPPKSPEDWMLSMNAKAAELIDKYPNPLAAITEKSNG